MAKDGYDVIVVGARCAGSPTAMLLARAGLEVLLVDRATFPSDTMSTHVVQPQGVAALSRWGLLDRVTETGCPPIDTYALDFGPFTITGSPGTPESPLSYCPRRTVLDKVLVDGAAEAGVEVREGFSVEEVLMDDGVVTGIRGHAKGGDDVIERAKVVVGADGLKSFVARAVGAEQYGDRPHQLCGYYSYWSGLPMGGRFETYIREDRGFAAAPTNDDLTLVVGGWPHAQLDANKGDIEGHWMAMFERAPEFAERIHAAKRESKIIGTSVPNFFRKPFGPGWALVGDAGYNKDFITAQGISDAFRDAELCADAIVESLAGKRSYDEAMGEYQATRDQHVLPMYDFTIQLASMEPPPPEMQQVLGAVHGNQDAMDGFVRVTSGMTSPAEFFSDENLGPIFAAAAQR